MPVSRWPRWVGTGRRKGVGRHLVRTNEAVLDSGWATARVAPTRASSPGCSGRRYRARRARRRPCRFPDGLVGSVRDAARAWDATSCERTKPCWIRDGRPRGSPLRGPRRRAVRGDAIAPAGRAVAHAGFPMASLGRYGTPQGRGTPPRTNETKPCWIRDGRPRGSPLRGPRRRSEAKPRWMP